MEPPLELRKRATQRTGSLRSGKTKYLQHSTSQIALPLRKFCSRDRNRFRDGDYDLDLTYITPQVVAMAIPATGIESAWRNDINDVSAMLDHYHKGHYMIWNLSDTSYDYTKFSDNVLEFGFPDHHSPPLDMLFKIVLTMHNWLKADTSNIAVVHCLGGKGRTGTVISCYLFFCGKFKNPVEALDFFAQKRSKIENGVKQPSQIRYVLYFDQILRSAVRPITPTIQLARVTICPIPIFCRKKKGCSPCLQVFNMTSFPAELVYSSAWEEDITSLVVRPNEVVEKTWNVHALLRGDFLISCTHVEGGKKTLMFRCSFHTAFISEDRMRLSTDQLDGIKQRKYDPTQPVSWLKSFIKGDRGVHIDENFYVEMEFQKCDELGDGDEEPDPESDTYVYEKIFAEVHQKNEEQVFLVQD